MAKRRPANRYKLERRGTTAKLIAALVAGGRPTELARPFNVSPQAIHGFIRRHKAELDTLTQQLTAQVQTVAIADKMERLRRLQYLVDKTHDVLEERGIIASEEKWIGGEFGRAVTVERYDAGLVRTYGQLLLQAAQELGAIPKAAGIDAAPPQLTQVNIQINNIEQPKGPADDRSGRIIEG